MIREGAEVPRPGLRKAQGPTDPGHRWFFVAAVVLTVWQLWVGQIRPPGTFPASYWLVTWQHGFVRRGLAGEINRALFRGDLEAGSDILSISVGVASAVAVLSVGWLILLLRRDQSAWWLALVMMASPLTARSLGAFGRPDQLGIVWFVAAGLALLLSDLRARRGILVVLSACLGAAVFIHEVTAVEVAPWFVLLLVAVANTWRARLIDAALALGLPFLSTVGTLILGTATHAQVVALRLDAEPYLHSGSYSVLVAIADALPDSLRLVASLGLPSMVGMATFAAAWIFVHAGILRLASLRMTLVFEGRAARLVALALIAPTLAALCATGHDWFRWASTTLTLWLLTLAMRVLSGSYQRSAPPNRARRVVLAVACTALALFPNFPAYNQGICTWNWPLYEWSTPYKVARDRLTGVTSDPSLFKRHRCGVFPNPATLR